MRLDDWLSAFSAVLFFAIAALASTRGARNPLAPPLAFLCVAFFAYDTLEVIRQLADDPMWDWLDRAAAALVAPPTLWLVATFVGMRRALAVPLYATTVYFCALASACALAIFVPALRWLPDGDAWALAMLGGMAPTFTGIPVVLALHAYRASTEERALTQIFCLAVLLGIGGITSELIAISGGATPRVAAIGIMVTAVLLGVIVLRARLIEDTRGLIIAAALAIASVAVLGHVLLLELFGDRTLLLVLGAVALTMSLLAALRPIQIALTERRERGLHLEMLGRFSEQMAHDLRNPLAAIRGAAQWLAEDSRSAAHGAQHQELIALVLDQADRVEKVVADYQRLGRAEALREPVDLRALVEQVATAQRAAGDRATTIRAQVDPSTPAEVLLDPNLVRGALENLVRNAREALHDAGRAGNIHLIVAPREREVSLRVEDDGPGMDARTRERAFDEFFTTKATGSGLGLAMVDRVARAHGGRASILSIRGGGTRVELTLSLG